MLNALYEYPVELTEVEVKDLTGIDITDDNRETFISAHIYVYDFLIYPTYNSDIKNRIIEHYIEELTKPLKKAILAQFLYMERQGDVGQWNGFLQGDGNAVNSTDGQDILTKIQAPAVKNILMGAAVNILYAGG